MTLNLRDWSEEKESLDREKNPKNPKGLQVDPPKYFRAGGCRLMYPRITVISFPN
jgi:hypothetical protein